MIPLDPKRAQEIADSLDQLDDELQALFDGFEQQVNYSLFQVDDELQALFDGFE